MLRHQTVNVRVGQALLCTFMLRQKPPNMVKVPHNSVNIRSIQLVHYFVKVDVTRTIFLMPKDKRIFLVHTELRYLKSGDLHALIKCDHDP